MKKLFLSSAAMFLGLSLVPAMACAQMTVHATAGTLKAVDAAAKTLSVAEDDGSSTAYQTVEAKGTKIDFDPQMRSKTTPAADYSKVGSHVVVFYYGYGNGITAVSVKPLGDGPFTTVKGTVVKFDKGKRMLTVKTDTGVSEIHIDDGAVIDTGDGVKLGTHFDPHHNDPVVVTCAASATGDKVGLFVKRNGF